MQSFRKTASNAIFHGKKFTSILHGAGSGEIKQLVYYARRLIPLLLWTKEGLGMIAALEWLILPTQIFQWQIPYIHEPKAALYKPIGEI
jgi:hypothetical protein